MRRNRFLWILLTLLPLLHGGCSSEEGPPCGGGFCRSNEVCEAGECVLGLVFEDEPHSDKACASDGDCPSGKVCTEENSDPAGTCIPNLPCEQNGDCQSGLHCSTDGVCR